MITKRQKNDPKQHDSLICSQFVSHPLCLMLVSTAIIHTLVINGKNAKREGCELEVCSNDLMQTQKLSSTAQN